MIAAVVKDFREKDLSVRVQSGGIELVEQIADAWRQLCDESDDEEVFYRPEWAQAYLQAFEPRADVVVISAWTGPKLRGVLPLVRHRVTVYGFPILKLSVPANVHSLRASLTVCAGEKRDAVLKTLWQAARDLPQWWDPGAACPYCRAEAERCRVRVPWLLFELRPVNGAAIEARRRSRLQAALAQPELL